MLELKMEAREHTHSILSPSLQILQGYKTGTESPPAAAVIWLALWRLLMVTLTSTVFPGEGNHWPAWSVTHMSDVTRLIPCSQMHSRLWELV